jgi:hypothetical protein
MIIFTEQTNAACRSVNYYSVENYVKHYNLIDVNNNEGSMGFFNSENLFVKINALGNYDNPNSISTKIMTSLSESITVKEKHINDPVYMYIEFDEKILINEIEMDIDAINTNTGKAVKKSIYLDGYKSRDVEGSSVLTSHHENAFIVTDSNDTLNLSINNQEIKSILIEFEYNKYNEYCLNLFNISEYSKMEHVGWSHNYIEGTNVKKMVICEGTGNYIPDGTDGKWYQSYTASFSPSIDIVSDYIPKRTSYYAVAYDSQHNGSLNYGATPTSIKSLFNDYSKIKAWSSEGNLPFKIFTSTADESNYIMTSKNDGYRYQVRPYYWDGNNKDYVHHITSSYCKEFTHQNITTCYKHYGHTKNAKTNYFDVYIEKYNNITPLEFQKIDNVKYYLCEKNSSCKFLKQTNDKITNINLETSGVYTINSVITDLYGNVNNKFSKEFYIDNDFPIVDYKVELDKYLNLKIKVIDELSGVKKYNYQVSKDGGLTYSDKSNWLYSENLELNYYSSGNYKFKVEVIDNADNSKIYYSNSYKLVVSDYVVSNAYGFSYDKNQESYLYYKIKCEGCVEEEDLELKVYQNNILIDSKIVSVQDYKDTSVKYLSNDNKIDFRIEITSKDTNTFNNLLKITIYSKTEKEIKSDQQLIKFKEIVCSMVNDNLEQVDYYENSSFQIVQDKSEYMAGEGIDVKVVVDYNNSCNTVSEYKCIQSKLLNADLIILFDEGLDSLNNYYLDNGKYKIEMNKNNNVYLLDRMYVDKKSADVYNIKKNNELLDGGYKWYTKFNSELKNYNYQIDGINIGYNDCLFKYFGEYSLNKNYVEEIKIRFVDLNNPFPNTKSTLWDNESFFNNLKNSKIIMTTEILEQ